MGSDIVIDFVNATKMVEVDMQILRRRAKVVLVGLFGGELRLSLVTMPTRAYKLIGSYTGNLTDLIELGTLSKKGLIRPFISDSFNRDQTTERCQVFRCREVTPRLFFIYAK
jgi:alcohol dehydrogenase, propanol-preferring